MKSSSIEINDHVTRNIVGTWIADYQTHWFSLWFITPTMLVGSLFCSHCDNHSCFDALIDAMGLLLRRNSALGLLAKAGSLWSHRSTTFLSYMIIDWKT
jgi:hypothetical protein